MADLDLIRRDLRAFSEAVGEALADWQAEALSVHAREQRETAIVGPRRSGKSRGAAVLALHHCYRGPERHALVISSSEEGAKRLLAQARRTAARSPLLRGSVASEQRQELRLSNGSTLRCVAATEAAVRGWTASLVVADEAALVSDEVLLGAARPIIASEPEGRFLLISSAVRASGAFFDAVLRGEAGSSHAAAFRWSLADCHWITATEREAARDSMSEIRWRAEYLGEFAGAADAVFAPVQLDDVTADFWTPPLEEPRPPARLVGGLDLGATHDRSALCAIGRLVVPDAEHPVFAVVGTKLWAPGHPLTTGSAAAPGVAEEVAALPAAWDTFVGEASGLGEAVCGSRGVLWRLMRTERGPHAGAGRLPRGPRVVADSPDDPLVALGVARYEDGTARARRRAALAAGHFRSRLVPFHVTAAGKAAMYSSLALLVGQRRLLIRAGDEELRRALLSLRVELSPTGLERVDAPRDDRGHGDLASALALCTMVSRGRDGGWYSRLAALANPARVRLPEPAVPPLGGPTVTTGGGLELPQWPLIASVAGGHVTDPASPAPLLGPEDPIPTWRRPV